MKPLTFLMPLFPARIRVFFNFEDFLARYPWEKSIDATTFNAFVTAMPDGICMVFINYSERVLVHESVHAAMHVMLRCYIKVDEHNDEPLAYSTDYIFHRVQKHYAKESNNG